MEILELHELNFKLRISKCYCEPATSSSNNNSVNGLNGLFDNLFYFYAKFIFVDIRINERGKVWQRCNFQWIQIYLLKSRSILDQIDISWFTSSDNCTVTWRLLAVEEGYNNIKFEKRETGFHVLGGQVK